MSIQVLRHEPFEHLGRFAEILTDKRIPFFYKDLGEPLALDACHGLIVMGGPQSANDALPGLLAELKLIEQAVVAETPVLGICLGAQLIAKALGARVYRNPEKEIGWAPVYFTETARRDPVFGDSIPQASCSTGTEKPSTCRWEPSGWLTPENAAIRHTGSGRTSMASSSTTRLPPK